jgi:hypothetical protein
MRALTRKHLIALMLACAPLTGGCDKIGGALDSVEQIPPIANRAVDTLREAVEKLTANSSSWQQVLKDALDKLTDETHKTIRNDVQQVLDRAVAAAGIEARCGAPFIADKVLASLKELLTDAEGVDGGPSRVAFPTACFFSPNPIRLEASPTDLAVDGYDFDAQPIGAILRGADGDVDVTEALSVSSHFQMVLDLQRVPFTAASRQIVFSWGGKEQGAVAIIQRETPPCKINRPPGTEGNLNAVYLLPDNVSGDAEYGSHRIKAFATASLIIENDQVYARVSMDAEEQGGDTRAFGEKYESVYRAPAGMRIRSLGLPADTAEFVLDSPGQDGVEENLTGSGPVANWKFKLNNKGYDAGVYTSVTVSFNQIRPELEEDGRDGHCFNLAPPRRALVLRGRRTAYDLLYSAPALSATPAFVYQQQIGLRYQAMSNPATLNAAATTIAVGYYDQGSTVKLQPRCSNIPGIGGRLKWQDGPCRGTSAAECQVTVSSTLRQDYSFTCD